MLFAVRLEWNISGRFDPSVAKVQARTEGLDGAFSVLTDTSMDRAGARFRSETEKRSRSVNKTPQVNCPKQNLLGREPLDDDHCAPTGWTTPCG